MKLSSIVAGATLTCGRAESLRLAVLSREDDLVRLADAWDELLHRSLTCEPMLSPAWLLPWWEVYARNTGRQLRVGVVLEGERLVGLIPLHCRRCWYRPGIPFRRLEFLGADVDEQDGVGSEYLNLIAEPDLASEVINGFVTALCQGAFGVWDELVLGAMDGDHPCTQSVVQALDKAGLKPIVTRQTTAPFIPLPRTWDDYLQALGGRHRRMLLKTLRDFEAWADGTASFRRATSPEQLNEAATLLRTLHGERWFDSGKPGGVFQSPRFDDFHQRFLAGLGRSGAAEICCLSVRGEPVAVNYNLLWNRKVYFYQCGRRLELPDKIRVGLVLHAQAIRAAISAGYREYDFLGGASQYKQQLALASRPVVQCRVSRAWGREHTRRLFERGLDCLRPLRRRMAGDGTARLEDRVMKSANESAPTDGPKAAESRCGPPAPVPTPPPPFTVVAIQDLSELESYRSSWDDLATSAVEANVFYESWMLLPALRAYGNGAITVVLIFSNLAPRCHGHRLLCGLVPLHRQKRVGVPILQLWSYIHCFLATPLLRTEFGAGALRALFDWLANDRQGAALLECGRITGDGPFYHLLLEHVHEERRGLSLVEAYVRAFLGRGAQPLDSHISGEKRKKLRRAEERLAKLGPVSYSALAQDGDPEAWLADFLRLEASGWKRDSGSALVCSDKDHDFFLEVMRAAFRQGRLMMLSLNLGGRPIAQLCNFLAGNSSFAFKVAFDREYARHSPGALLELENLRQFEAHPELHWMDSCTDADDSLIKQLWQDRRIIQTVLVETGRAPGPLVLVTLPLYHWLKRRLGSILRRRPVAGSS
jgi:CelD/BcsL family acetyltransferase involved in cellulose biosynthesis